MDFNVDYSADQFGNKCISYMDDSGEEMTIRNKISTW